MNGESIHVARNEKGEVKITTNSGEAKIIIGNIKIPKIGVVHVVDKVFL